MSTYTDHLWQDLARDHGAALLAGESPERPRARVLRRPRVLAGSALGLAGAATALVLALGGGTPAYAVTVSPSGSVLVTLNETSALPQVEATLASMGTNEAVTIQMASGAASSSGPVLCTRETGASGPAVQVLVGTDGTEVVPSSNTGAGTWHLASCTVSSTSAPAVTGNSGTAAAPTSGNSGTAAPAVTGNS